MIKDLLNMDFAVEYNNLQPVTDPILCEKGNIPRKNGLLSTDIFGVTINERKRTFAYIDLGSKYLHPYVYKVLKRLNRKIDNVIDGSKRFILVDGVLKEDEGGNTGIEWLYSIYDKLKFPRNDSSIRNERIDLLEAYKKDEAFLDKWIIIPAYYRDMNLEKREVSHEELNDYYSKLIRLTLMSQNNNEFDFVIYSTQASIQKQLVEIYDYFKVKLEKKKGFIRRANLGKSTTMGSRLVITAPRFDAEKPEEMPVSFEYAGVPLAQVCAMFFPFIISYVKRYLIMELEQHKNKYPVKLKNWDKIKYVQLEEPSAYFTDDYIKKQIKKFIYGYSNRFIPVEIPIKHPEDVENKKIYMAFRGKMAGEDVLNPDTESNIFVRRATWCDLLYQAAVDVTENKHVVITRYPVTDYFSSFFNKIHVVSTHKTMPVYIGDRLYPDYPIIDFDAAPEQVETMFQDSLTMSNLLLEGLGGDYDGNNKLPGYTEMYACKWERKLESLKANQNGRL